MYPAQTSFIPVQIALARFLESQGWRAIFAHYPYWYLGTTPFRYLTGPILPGLLVITHKIFPGLSLFEVFWGWLGLFWVIGGIGVYLMVNALIDADSLRGRTSREVRPPQGMALLAAVFYLFGPITPFLFRFSDGLSLMAFSVLPWVYAKYAKFLRREKHERGRTSREVRPPRGAWGLLGLMALAILLDTSVIPSMILGMAGVFLATTGWKKAEERIKQSFKLLAFSLLLATIWYTPTFWWQLLAAPSFAGKPLFRVIGLLGQLLPIALAIGLAIISGKFIKFKKHSIFGVQYSVFKFCFYWLFIFGFLTLMRFISDPDFWLDWSSYGIELQMGLGIGLGLIGQNAKRKTQNDSLKLKTFSLLAVAFTFYFLLFTFVFDKYVLGTLQKDITQTVEYRVSSQLARITKPPSTSSGQAEKVFLSGTTVFWLNTFFDIPQVRGGMDLVSVHPDWRRAAWEIREGTDPEKSIRALRELGVSFLVVHTQDSAEFWHDFQDPEKFEGLPGLEKIYDEKGDRIYKIKN